MGAGAGTGAGGFFVMMASPTNVNCDGSRRTRAGGLPAYAQRLSDLVLTSSGLRWYTPHESVRSLRSPLKEGRGGEGRGGEGRGGEGREGKKDSQKVQRRRTKSVAP